MKNNKKVELLAPAGSLESLFAAVLAGADAVYIGGSRFGARAFAKNVTEEELLYAIDYMHLHNRKLYLTVNTLVKEKELEQFYDYLLPYYRQGLDAVIVQDIGVISFIKKRFPGLPVHISTQMTVTGADGARQMEKLGAERVVPARELSLEEIRHIREKTGMEIECFVHGALCYCYSGQCLYSSIIGGRSGNRGRCAQPCRLPFTVQYREGHAKSRQDYALSTKDLCTLTILPDLIEAGIDSFKIEGRMKKPEYTAGVTAIYRKYIDLYYKMGRAGYRVEQDDIEKLMELYNRGGFTTGYYEAQNGPSLMSMSRQNHYGAITGTVKEVKKDMALIRVDKNINKGDSLEIRRGETETLFEWKAAENLKEKAVLKLRIPKQVTMKPGYPVFRMKNMLLEEQLGAYVHQEIKENIRGTLRVSKDLPVMLTVEYRGISVTEEGEVVQQAKSQPVDSRRLEKQVKKTGNTPFSFESLSIEADTDAFVSMQGINEVRRKALERLENSILQEYRRENATVSAENNRYKTEESSRTVCGIRVQVQSKEQLERLMNCEDIEAFYLAPDMLHLYEQTEQEKLKKYCSEIKANGKKVYFVFPHIFRKNTKKAYEQAGILSLIRICDGAVIKNWEEYTYMKENADFEKKFEIIGDYNLYTFNREAWNLYQELGFSHMTMSPELNAGELRSMKTIGQEMIVYGYLPLMVSAQCVAKNHGGCIKKETDIFIKDRYQKSFYVKNHCDFCYNTIYNSTPISLLSCSEEIEKLNLSAIRLLMTTEEPEETLLIVQKFADAFLRKKKDVSLPGEYTKGHFKRGVE